MGLSLRVWFRKIVHGVETHQPSDKEKVPGTVVSKGHADSLLGYGRTHAY